jgi:hypothetical protein
MATWPVKSRDMLIALGISISTLYIGLDLAIAPETSLWYRIEKSMPFTWATPGSMRAMGAFIILMSLFLAGYLSLDYRRSSNSNPKCGRFSGALFQIVRLVGASRA